MKKLGIPGVANIYKVEEPEEILALAQNPVIDRKFDLRTCPFNWLLLKRSLYVLSFKGRRFPTMTPQACEERQIHQRALAKTLHERAVSIRLGPEELDPLAHWVRGEGLETQVGVLIQQLLGRLFLPEFVATDESWAAAKVLVAAPRSWKPKVFWWLVTGKVRRSKQLLAQMVNGDLSAVNAIGIAVHNVVKGLRHMRTLYADSGIRTSLPPAAASRRCLFSPVSLYRQATEAGQVGDCPFSQNSLFIFETGKAGKREGGLPLIFMDGTWSRCPAADWVPALFEGLWLRATGVAEKSEDGESSRRLP